MTIAQKLKNEGRVEGEWIGRLQTLQEIMGLPVDTAESLASLSTEELRCRFEALQAEYNRRHKE